MSTYDDETELEFFEEPETLEAPGRPRRRIRPQRGGGPRRPAPPPPGAVALARLAGLVALAIAVVVGLVFWVGSCQGQSKQDEYKSYMASLQPIAQSSAASLSAYQRQLNSPKLTLADLESKLNLWSKQQQESYDQAVRLVPPGPLQSAHQQVLTTLQLRAIGLTGLANTFATAGSKPSSQVGALLAKQAQLLTASDLVWANLFRLPATETLKREGVQGVIAPPSQIVPSSNVVLITPHSFEELYNRLHSTTSTGEVTGIHGSQLLSTEAVSGSQAQTLSASTPTKVNVAANLKFRVSFKNSGHFQENNVPVTLAVSAFGKKLLSPTQKVQSIEPGETKTVSFANLNLPPSAFGQATVTVVVGKVPGEKILTNNRASYPVFFSLPPNG
ncbi:MAG TPA: CARDB domain-containing protein [Gaiellaceae bacterium]